MRLADTSYVPTLRQVLYALIATSSVVLAILSATLLAYQLRWTIGYNKPVVRPNILSLPPCAERELTSPSHSPPSSSAPPSRSFTAASSSPRSPRPPRRAAAS